MTKMGHSTRALRRAGGGAAALLAACSGLALAAEPVAGASYSGNYKGSAFGITFTVSANGKRVKQLDPATPVSCPGSQGVGGLPAASGSAAISKRGTFRVKLNLRSPEGKVAGTEVVTGTFESHRRAKGKVTAHLFQNAICHGVTRSYTAKVRTTG